MLADYKQSKEIQYFGHKSNIPDVNRPFAKQIDNINTTVSSNITSLSEAIRAKVHNNIESLFNRVSTAVQLRIRLRGSLCLSYSLSRRSTPPVREVIACKVRTHARMHQYAPRIYCWAVDPHT